MWSTLVSTIVLYSGLSRNRCFSQRYLVPFIEVDSLANGLLMSCAKVVIAYTFHFLCLLDRSVPSLSDTGSLGSLGHMHR